MTDEDAKKGWGAIGESPEKVSNWLAHMRLKADFKQAVTDGSLDDAIAEAEYKCEGER